jgi:hypothetical protein
MSNKLELWPKSNWDTIYQNLKLGIIDFRHMSNLTSIGSFIAKKPYFEIFMEAL